MAIMDGAHQWTNRLRRMGNISLPSSAGLNMNWIGKIRPQVLTAIIFLGSMGLYSIYNGGYEAATGFGALVGMLAKEVIASDD